MSKLSNMCSRVRVCVFLRARPYVVRRMCVHVEQQLRACVSMAVAAAVGVCVCVWVFGFFLVFFFWVRVLSVCCVSAVSHGNAWLPIQAGADPAVPS